MARTTINISKALEQYEAESDRATWSGCFFEKPIGVCTILRNGVCDDPTRCKFYKTEDEYINSLNESILLNREKGNCESCKYKTKQCKLVTKSDLEVKMKLGTRKYSGIGGAK